VDALINEAGFKYNERFLEFIKLFGKIGADSRIFPKTCSTCGRQYRSFPEYIHDTEPVAHCLENYADVLFLIVHNAVPKLSLRQHSCDHVHEGNISFAGQLLGDARPRVQRNRTAS
jgi:hypothetical protein